MTFFQPMTLIAVLFGFVVASEAARLDASAEEGAHSVPVTVQISAHGATVDAKSGREHLRGLEDDGEDHVVMAMSDTAEVERLHPVVVRETKRVNTPEVDFGRTTASAVVAIGSDGQVLTHPAVVARHVDRKDTADKDVEGSTTRGEEHIESHGPHMGPAGKPSNGLPSTALTRTKVKAPQRPAHIVHRPHTDAYIHVRNKKDIFGGKKLDELLLLLASYLGPLVLLGLLGTAWLRAKLSSATMVQATQAASSPRSPNRRRATQRAEEVVQHAAEDSDCKMPSCLRLPCLGVQLLLFLSMSSILPSSREVTLRAGLPLSTAGFTVSSAFIGALVGSALFYFMRHAPLIQSFACFATVLSVGNLMVGGAIWHGKAPVMLLCGRMVIGIGFGVSGLCQIIVAHSTSGAARTAFLGYLYSAGCAALLLGPPLASSVEGLAVALGSNWEFSAALPSFLLCIFSVAFGVEVRLSVFDTTPPSPCRAAVAADEEVPTAPTIRPPLTLSLVAPGKSVDESKAQLAQWLNMFATLLRCVLRLGWEAGAVWLMSERVGHEWAGMILVGAAGAYGTSQLLWGHLLRTRCREVSELTQATVFCSLGVVGCGCMLSESLVSFVIGSLIFFPSVSLTGPAVLSWCTTMATPPVAGKDGLAETPANASWLAEVDSVILLNMIATCIGSFLGPYVVGVILQSAFGATSMVLILGSTLIAYYLLILGSMMRLTLPTGHWLWVAKSTPKSTPL